jgi:signal transduction histidine kinase
MKPAMENSQPALSDPQGSDELNHAWLVQLRWFSFIGVLEIRLRWFAAAGVLIGTWILDSVLDLPIPNWPLYVIGLCMFIYNYLLHRYLERTFTYPTRVSDYDYEGLLQFYWRGVERKGIAEAASFDRFVQVQLSLDWIAMILLVHFTGGVTSPLLFFFVFHLIVASALLSRAACYLFATLAVLAVALLALLEGTGIIPHYSIGLISESVHHNGLYIAAILFQFTTSMYMTVYLATTLTKFLRQRDEQMLRLQQSLSDAYQLIQTLYNVTKTVSSTLDLNEVLDLVAQSAAEAMQVRACSIMLVGRTGTRIDTVASFGLSDQYLNAGPIDLDQTHYVSETLAMGQPTIVGDTSKDDRLLYPEATRAERIASILCVPLLIRNRAEGVICVYSDQPGHFIERDAEFLAALAGAGATAVENARSYEALQTADRAKSDFVRMITHEFRSPLSAVQSMLRLLELGIVEPLGEKQRDLVERSQRRVSHLLALVNDLLELAAGKMQPLQSEKQKVDLSNILAKVSEIMQPRAVEKGLRYAVDVETEPLLLAGFEDSLERMIMNLISNAVKYTPSGGTVSVKAGCEHGEIALEVSDTGIGIPEEAMSRIFSEFYRAKNAKSTNVDGTGLGLVIVKDVVEQHGGRISVRSRVGEGTTFTISLPQE